jgi:hypothetical protein
MVDIQVSIARDPKNPPGVRVAAADAVLNRGLGRAPVAVDLLARTDKRLEDMTPDELIAYRQQYIETVGATVVEAVSAVEAERDGQFSFMRHPEDASEESSPDHE